jgi:ketosteroid isomerase-like protein
MQRLIGLRTYALLFTAVLGLAFGARADCDGPKTVAELRDCWQQSWDSKQIDAVVQLYADDGVLITGDGRFQGHADIKTYLKTKMDSGNVQFAFDSLTHVEPNKFGYDSGTFSENSTSTSGAAQQDGSYLFVARRDEKGTLSIVQQAFVVKKPRPPVAPCPQCFL